MTTLLQDLRYGLRMLRKTPGFTAVAVITLALGIGANSAMFSVVYQVMFRPLPYVQPERLVHLVTRWRQGYNTTVVPAIVGAADERTHSFQAVANTFPSTGCNLVGGNTPEYVPNQNVSLNFFRTLGVAPVLGRDFAGDEGIPGGNRVALLSYGLWQRRFGGDRNVLGRQIQCNGNAVTVIGVLPRNFRFSRPAEVWMPARLADYLHDNGMNYEAIARLKPGVTLAQAQADLDATFQQLRRDFPGRWWTAEKARGPGVLNYRQWDVGQLRQPLLILFGAVVLVLLIACANLAGLLLARSTARAHELAVRVALGAGRGRIARQLLTETLLVNLIGGAAGLGLAAWLVQGLKAILPAQGAEVSFGQYDVASMHVNLPVLLFTLGATLATALISGIVPAWASAGADPQSGLKQGEHSSGLSHRQHRSRKVLLVAEVAVSLVLLAGATLLVRSFLMLQQVNLGFDPRNLQVAQISLASKKFKSPDVVWSFQQKVLERLGTLPGVVGAASVSSSPLQPGLNIGAPVVNGKSCDSGIIDYRGVSPSFFQVMRLPLLRGRGFTDSDAAQANPVVVINEATARACWRGEDPLGRQVDVEGLGVPRQVVGIAADVKEYAVFSPAPAIVYVPQSQVGERMIWNLYHSFGLLSAVTVRTSRPMDLSVPFERIVQEVDSEQPVASISPMTQLVSESIAFTRLLMVLMVGFAGLAVLLTATGLYGLLTYYVTQRRAEIGIRIALGAGRRDVLRLVLGEGCVLVAIGSVAGLGGALAATRLLASLLFAVQPRDPLSLAVTAAFTACVALLACLVPAHRATRVDPMVALRYE